MVLAEIHINILEYRHLSSSPHRNLPHLFSCTLFPIPRGFLPNRSNFCFIRKSVSTACDRCVFRALRMSSNQNEQSVLPPSFVTLPAYLRSAPLFLVIFSLRKFYHRSLPLSALSLFPFIGNEEGSGADERSQRPTATAADSVAHRDRTTKTAV